MRLDGTFRHKDHATNGTIRFGGEMTGKRNSCREVRWSPQESEWKSNGKYVEHMTRLWRLKMGSKGNTDAGHEGDGEMTRYL